jgi:hypothetical protein
MLYHVVLRLVSRVRPRVLRRCAAQVRAGGRTYAPTMAFAGGAAQVGSDRDHPSVVQGACARGHDRRAVLGGSAAGTPVWQGATRSGGRGEYPRSRVRFAAGRGSRIRRIALAARRRTERTWCSTTKCSSTARSRRCRSRTACSGTRGTAAVRSIYEYGCQHYQYPEHDYQYPEHDYQYPEHEYPYRYANETRCTAPAMKVGHYAVRHSPCVS